MTKRLKIGYEGGRIINCKSKSDAIKLMVKAKINLANWHRTDHKKITKSENGNCFRKEKKSN